MAGRSTQGITFWGRLWGLLTSRLLAVVLFLLLLGLLLLAVWFPQEPADLDSTALAHWRDLAAERLGTRLALYEALGLLHLFRTPFFWTLAGLLLLNTLCCTLDRLGGLWRAATRRPVIALPASAYPAPAWEVPGVTPEHLRRALRWRACRTWSEAGHLYAETFPLARLGTVLGHLGLFFLLLSAILHGAFSWREQMYLYPPDFGSPPIPLAHRPLCRLLHGELSVDRPGKVRAAVRVWRGTEEQRELLAPGRPFSACGVTFLLRSYGLALGVEVQDAAGRPLEVLTPDGRPYLTFPEGISETSFEVPALDWRVVVIPSPRALVGLNEPLHLRIEQAGRSQPLLDDEVAGGGVVLPQGQLRLTRSSFLALEAVHDPGMPWFLAGGAALFLGSALVLLLPRRQLWARLDEAGRLWVWPGRGWEEERLAALARSLGRGGGG